MQEDHLAQEFKFRNLSRSFKKKTTTMTTTMTTGREGRKGEREGGTYGVKCNLALKKLRQEDLKLRRK